MDEKHSPLKVCFHFFQIIKQLSEHGHIADLIALV